MEPISLAVADAARARDVSKSTVSQFAGARTIPSFRVGTRLLIPVKALQEWVDGRPCTGTNLPDWPSSSGLRSSRGDEVAMARLRVGMDSLAPWDLGRSEDWARRSRTDPSQTCRACLSHTFARCGRSIF